MASRRTDSFGQRFAGGVASRLATAPRGRGLSTDEEHLTGNPVPSDARSRIAHNTLLNLFGLGIPLAVALFVLPIAAHHLGPGRFGLLALAWALTEYLALFDLGLGRATVKFIADGLQGDANDLSEIASLSVGFQLVAGLFGGLLFFVAAGSVVDAA